MCGPNCRAELVRPSLRGCGGKALKKDQKRVSLRKAYAKPTCSPEGIWQTSLMGRTPSEPASKRAVYSWGAQKVSEQTTSEPASKRVVYGWGARGRSRTCSSQLFCHLLLTNMPCLLTQTLRSLMVMVATAPLHLATMVLTHTLRRLTPTAVSTQGSIIVPRREC